MPGIAAHQFSPNLRVKALPESSKVRSRLYRAMIRSQQMDDERCLVRPDPRGILHSEEILETGGDPRRFSRLVVDLRVTSISEANAQRGDLIEESGIQSLFQQRYQVCRSNSQFCKALESNA